MIKNIFHWFLKEVKNLKLIEIIELVALITGVVLASKIGFRQNEINLRQLELTNEPALYVQMQSVDPAGSIMSIRNLGNSKIRITGISINGVKKEEVSREVLTGFSLEHILKNTTYDYWSKELIKHGTNFVQLPFEVNFTVGQNKNYIAKAEFLVFKKQDGTIGVDTSVYDTVPGI